MVLATDVTNDHFKATLEIILICMDKVDEISL